MKKVISIISMVVFLVSMVSMAYAASNTTTLQDYSNITDVKTVIAKGWDDPKVDLSKVSLDGGRIKVDTDMPEPNICYLFPVADLSKATYVEFDYEGFGTAMEPPADNNSYTIGLVAKNPDTGALEIVEINADSSILVKDAKDSDFVESKTGPGHTWGWISKNFKGVIRIPLNIVPLTDTQKANIVGIHWVLGGNTIERGKFFYVDNIRADAAVVSAPVGTTTDTSTDSSTSNPKTGDPGLLAMLIPLVGSSASLVMLRRKKKQY